MNEILEIKNRDELVVTRPVSQDKRTLTPWAVARIIVAICLIVALGGVGLWAISDRGYVYFSSVAVSMRSFTFLIYLVTISFVLSCVIVLASILFERPE